MTVPEAHSFSMVPSSLTQWTVYSNRAIYFCIRRQSQQYSSKGSWAPLQCSEFSKSGLEHGFKHETRKGLGRAIKTHFDSSVLFPPLINLLINYYKKRWRSPLSSIPLSSSGEEEAATSGTWPRKKKIQKYNRTFRNQKPQLTRADE